MPTNGKNVESKILVNILKRLTLPCMSVNWNEGWMEIILVIEFEFSASKTVNVAGATLIF